MLTICGSIAHVNNQYRVYGEGVMENSGDRIQIVHVKVVLEENSEIMYILSEQTFDGEYGVSGKGYNITIQSQIEGVFESVNLEDVSRDQDEAFELLALFAKNTVTPDSALYIMEDLLS